MATVSITKPTVNGSAGTWGTINNQALDDIVTGVNQRVDATTATTKGDLLVATASATVARHAVGTDGQVLVADSTQTNGVKWVAPGIMVSVAASRPAASGTPVGTQWIDSDTNYTWVCNLISGTKYWTPTPGSRVLDTRQTTQQSLTAGGTLTSLVWQTPTVDRYAVMPTGTAVFTPGIPGVYEFSGAVSFVTGTTGTRFAGWMRNATLVNWGYTNLAPASTTVYGIVVPARTITYTMSATDTMALAGTSSVAGTINTEVTAGYQSHFTAKYLGPA